MVGPALPAWASPAAVVQLLIVLAFSLEWLADDLKLVPPEATWTIEGLIVVLAVWALWGRFPDRVRTAATNAPAAALLVVGAGTALMHGETPWTIALGARVLFRFVLLYYVLLNLNVGETAWRGLIRLCLLLVLVQVLIGSYQFWVLGKTDDEVFGSLRSSGAIVLVSAAALCTFAALYIQYRPSLRYLAAIPILFVLPVIGEAKGFLFLVPLPMAIVLGRGLRVDRWRTVVVATVLLLSEAGAIVFYGAVDGNANLLKLFGQPQLIGFILDPPRERLGAPGKGPRYAEVDRSPLPLGDFAANNPPDVAVAASTWPRIVALGHAIRHVGTGWDTALLGYGMGSRTFTRGEVSAAGTNILYVSPLGRRIFEGGLAGVLAYWMLLLATLIPALPLTKLPTPYWRAMALALPGLAVLFILGETYTETQMDAPALMFWLLAASVACHSAPPDGPI